MSINGVDRVLKFNHGFYNQKIIDEPRSITFKHESYKGINIETMKRWIRNHTDTSISISDDNKFFSKGSLIGISDCTYITADLTNYVRSGNELYIDSTAHHDEDWHLWTYNKLGVKDLLPTIKYFENKLIQERQYLMHKNKKKYCLVVNTKWSANNYFHWILEAIPRLKLIIDNLGEEMKFVEIIWLGEVMPKRFHLESLRNIGLEINTHITSNNYPVMFENIIMASFKDAGSICRSQVDEGRKAYGECVTEGGSKKSKNILLLRRSKVRELILSDEVENIIAKNGFKKIYAEDISLIEQKMIFSNIDILISAHGAGLTNLIHMKSGAKVIEIMPSNSIHPLYWYLSGISDLKYAMIPTKVNDKEQSLIVDPNLLAANILEMI